MTNEEAHEIRAKALAASSVVHMRLAKMRDDILAIHKKRDADAGHRCMECDWIWPCDTARLAQACLPTETR